MGDSSCAVQTYTVDLVPEYGEAFVDRSASQRYLNPKNADEKQKAAKRQCNMYVILFIYLFQDKKWLSEENNADNSWK